ncbi:acyltransferase [Salmonirosea aquatica]|uniref:Acyltransferase n=1 Tax=Salmonirosea aquatica TaxID=2654236 RepID=A0A7C9BC52_9BACT|nr:acyltransferase [Cytophagaceae bacterium SJW1-29]
MGLKELILRNAGLKKFLHRLLFPKDDPRPRSWVNVLLNPFYHTHGRRVRIRRSVRMDVVPFNPLTIGARTIIEDFTVVNNGVGPVQIGQDALIGMSNVIIGPVSIGDKVIMAQHVVASGLNHGYRDPQTAIKDQPVETAPITIGDACWLGANVVVTAGVTIGKHCVVAAGSVVTKSIPPYSVAVGNPARVIRTYDFASNSWIKAS